MLRSRVAFTLLALMLSYRAAAQTPVQTISMWSFDFSPRPIHLAAGRPVILTFVNRSGSGHDFTAKDFFAKSQITAGAAPSGKIELGAHQSKSITLIPHAGTYKAYCGHFLHRQFGMEDAIVVN